MKLTSAICKSLQEKNITQIFAMSGANNEDLLQEIHQNKDFTLTIVKNESNAVFMAMGSYLKTKNIAAVITTSGSAILNTISPLTEAYTSKIPLLVIGGQIPQQFEGLGAFQDNSGNGNSINILDFFKPTTAFSERIHDKDYALESLSKAINISATRKEPSVFTYIRS